MFASFFRDLIPGEILEMSDRPEYKMLDEWMRLRRALVGLRDKVQREAIVTKIFTLEQALKDLGIVRFVKAEADIYPEEIVL